MLTEKHADGGFGGVGICAALYYFYMSMVEHMPTNPHASPNAHPHPNLNANPSPSPNPNPSPSPSRNSIPTPSSNPNPNP